MSEKKISRREYIKYIGIAGVAAGAAAAGTYYLTLPPVTPQPDEEVKKLRLLGCWGEGSRESEMIKIYEELSGIQMEYEIVPWEGILEKLAVIFSTKAWKDYDLIFLCDPSPHIYGPFLKDLRPLAKDYGFPDGTKIEDIVEPALAYCSPWPHAYSSEIILRGMPHMYYGPRVLYYNKTMFKEAGLDPESPPTTWDEFHACAKDLTTDDTWGWAASFATYCEAQNTWAATARQVDVYDFGGYPDVMPTFNNERGEMALQYLVDMYQEGLIDPASITYPSFDDRPLFLSGKAGMIQCWSFLWNNTLSPEIAAENVVNQVGHTILPKGPGPYGKHGSHDIPEILSIPDHGDEKRTKAAWDFIAWVSCKEQQKWTASNWNRLPTIKSLYEDTELLEKPNCDIFKTTKYYIDNWANEGGPKEVFMMGTHGWELMEECASWVQKALVKDLTVKNTLNEWEEAVRKIIGDTLHLE